MKNKNAINLVIVAVVALGIGFYGGTKYSPSKTAGPNGTGQQFGQFRNGAGGANRRAGGGMGFVNGEILSKDDKSVTIKLRDGGSKIVFFSAKTAIGKTTDGTLDDLAVGKTVVVNGATNSDGSVTAENIQIRPAVVTPPAALKK